MIEKYLDILRSIGTGMHFSPALTEGLAGGIAILTLLVLGVLLYFLAKFLIKKTVYIIIQKTPSKYDDLLIKNKVLIRILANLMMIATVSGKLGNTSSA